MQTRADVHSPARHAGSCNVLVAAAIAASAAVVSAQPATGGTGRLTGHVELLVKSSRRLPTPGAYPNRTVTTAPRQSAAEVEHVIVFVKAPAQPTTPTRVEIRQHNEEFVPRVVAVTAGSTVAFPNDDPFFHNVFSLSRAATFDLGRYPRGDTKARTFSRPGIVKVFCHLHSHMSALVRVFDHPHFARPDRSGRFEIAGLPDGRYEAVAWHERVGEVTRAVSVRSGQITDLSFVLPLNDEG